MKQDIEKSKNDWNESTKNTNELINHYKDHIAYLKKTIEKSGSISEKSTQDKEPCKENLQFNNFNTQNIINISNFNKCQKHEKPHAKNSVDDDIDLKILELESIFFFC